LKYEFLKVQIVCVIHRLKLWIFNNLIYLPTNYNVSVDIRADKLYHTFEIVNLYVNEVLKVVEYLVILKKNNKQNKYNYESKRC